MGGVSDATQLLNAIGHGDTRAANELLPLIYEDLRRLAAAHMGHECPGHTLQATALVHEVYLRLVGDAPTRWDGRRHFFAAAAEAMRRILVEHARRRNSLKRGGASQRVDLGDDLPAIASPCDGIDDLLALNDALDRLAREDCDLAELVKLSYFAGMRLEEAAQTLGISRATAYRRWSFARAWLHDAISGGDLESEPRSKGDGASGSADPGETPGGLNSHE